MDIYGRIKELRLKKGMTQDELAVEMGYKSRSTINKIEAGERDISRSQIAKFAEVLETTPAYLMGWEKENPKEKPKTKTEIIIENLTEKTRKGSIKWVNYKTTKVQNEIIELKNIDTITESYGIEGKAISELYFFVSGSIYYVFICSKKERLILTTCDCLGNSVAIRNTHQISSDNANLSELLQAIRDSFEDMNKDLFNTLMDDLNNL